MDLFQWNCPLRHCSALVGHKSAAKMTAMDEMDWWLVLSEEEKRNRERDKARGKIAAPQSPAARAKLSPFSKLLVVLIFGTLAVIVWLLLHNWA